MEEGLAAASLEQDRVNPFREKLRQQDEKNQLKVEVDKRLDGNIDFNELVFSVLNPNADKIDWLTFETRIRQIVTEMVEPIKDKTIDCT